MERSIDMKTLEQETVELAKRITEPVEAFRHLFDQCGIDSKSTGDGNGLYIECPHCEQPYKLHVRCENSRKDYPSWRCYVCGCQRRWFDSYIGLFRLVFSKQQDEAPSPFQTLRRIEAMLSSEGFLDEALCLNPTGDYVPRSEFGAS